MVLFAVTLYLAVIAIAEVMVGGNGQMIAKAVGVSGKFCPNVLILPLVLGSEDLF